MPPGLDASALSAELGLLKPDSGMYRSTCTMLGVLPGQVQGLNSPQTPMIGDSRRCDEQGPRCFGILGHHLDRTGGGALWGFDLVCRGNNRKCV